MPEPKAVEAIQQEAREKNAEEKPRDEILSAAETIITAEKEAFDGGRRRPRSKS